MKSAVKKTLVAMATAALSLSVGCGGEPASSEAEGSTGGEAAAHTHEEGACGCGGEGASDEATEEASGEEASCGGEEASCGGEEG